MPASRPTHSWRFPHSVFACYPAALITSLARARRSVSHMPTGRTPGLLSSATRRHSISAQWVAQGGEEVASQSSKLATTTLSSSKTHPKRRSQFRSSIASDPSAPAAPESFDATHVMSSSVKLRVTVSGTSSYSSKAAHVGFSTGDTHVRVFLPENLCNRLPGFWCIGLPEGDTLPPTDRLPDGQPDKAYQTTLCRVNSGPLIRPPPRRRRWTCSLRLPLPSWRPPSDLCAYPSPRGPCAT